MNAITPIPTRHALIARTAIASFMLFGATASTEDGSPSMEESAAIEAWQAETTEALNAALLKSSAAHLMRPNSAIVQVTFMIGEDGKARDIEIVDGEGNWGAQRASIFAVKNLDTLSRFPGAQPGKRKFLANFIFYRSIESRQRFRRQLARSETLRLASKLPARNYLAIGER